MRNSFWIFQRNDGVYYLQDRMTGKQQRMRAKGSVEVERRFSARIQAVEQPTISTNVWLCVTHHYAHNLAWPLSPAMVREAWPIVLYKQSYAIIAEEHRLIINAEANQKRQLYDGMEVAEWRCQRPKAAHLSGNLKTKNQKRVVLTLGGVQPERVLERAGKWLP